LRYTSNKSLSLRLRSTNNPNYRIRCTSKELFKIFNKEGSILKFFKTISLKKDTQHFNIKKNITDNKSLKILKKKSNNFFKQHYKFFNKQKQYKHTRIMSKSSVFFFKFSKYKILKFSHGTKLFTSLNYSIRSAYFILLSTTKTTLCSTDIYFFKNYHNLDLLTYLFLVKEHLYNKKYTSVISQNKINVSINYEISIKNIFTSNIFKSVYTKDFIHTNALFKAINKCVPVHSIQNRFNLFNSLFFINWSNDSILLNEKFFKFKNT